MKWTHILQPLSSKYNSLQLQIAVYLKYVSVSGGHIKILRFVRCNFKESKGIQYYGDKLD